MPIRSRTILALALLAALVTAAAGCGSKNSRQTRRELVRDAGAICSRAQAAMDALPQPNPPTNGPQVAAYLVKLVKVADDRLKALEALPQGTGEVQQDFYAFLFIEREATATLRSIAYHAQGNHPGALELEIVKRTLYKAGLNADNTLGACAVPARFRSTSTAHHLQVAVQSGGRKTVNPQAAEELVRESVARDQLTTGNPLTKVTALSCPPGIPDTPGTIVPCKLSLADGTSGTITLHIDRHGRRLEVFAPDDYHLK
jgi:hypothetical protein